MRWFIIVLLLFAATRSIAQTQKPWQPFPFGQVSYYKNNKIISNAHSFYTLSADSSKVDGSDTIVFLNRKLYPGEPLCVQPGSTLWDEPFIPIYDPLVRDSFRVSGDTTWLNGASLYSDAWLFNTPILQPMNFSGNGYFVWDSAWYEPDIQDSVRRITLYASLSPVVLVKKDTMRISKSHGLVKVSLSNLSVCPAKGNELDLRLCGFDGPSLQWGFATPQAERYVNYYPGDIIKWHVSQQSISGNTDQYIRDSVTSVVGDPTYVTCNVWRIKQIYENGDFVSETQQATYMGFNMTELRLQAKRTTSQMSADTTSGLTHDVYEIVLRENVDGSCEQDTMLEAFVFSTYYVPDACQIGVVTDNNHSVMYSTKRGLMGSTVSGVSSYSQTNQIGYYSPTKGISCGDFVPLGANTLVSAHSISVYPAPTHNNLTLDFHQPVSGTLNVLDATGRLIHTQQLTANDLVMLDVSALSPSIYFVRVMTNGGVYTSKFVKQ
jgi:hypothetical protein